MEMDQLPKRLDAGDHAGEHVVVAECLVVSVANRFPGRAGQAAP